MIEPGANHIEAAQLPAVLMRHEVVGVFLHHTFVAKGAQWAARYVFAGQRSQAAIGQVFNPLEDRRQIPLVHVTLAALFIGKLHLVAHHQDVRIEDGDPVLRGKIAGSMEEFCTDHLCPAGQLAVPHGIELDEIVRAKGIPDREPGGDAVRFRPHNHPLPRCVRARALIGAIRQFIKAQRVSQAVPMGVP